MVRRRTIPTKDEARPRAADYVDMPLMVIRDGERCGPLTVKTGYGVRDAYAVRVITADGDQGRVLFFWISVVMQLTAALKESDDASFITIHKEGREYVASPVDDEATIETLEKAFASSRPADTDPPAEAYAEPEPGDDEAPF